MEVDLATGLGCVGVIASGFALFQNYTHKKLSFVMSSRIKDLEEARTEIKLELREQKVLLNDAIKKIDSLEREISSLKKALKELISKSESLANRFSHIDERLTNHEEKLLKMARSAAEDAAFSVSSRVIQAELNPAMHTIKYVERAVQQIKRELKESSMKAARELEF